VKRLPLALALLLAACPSAEPDPLPEPETPTPPILGDDDDSATGDDDDSVGVTDCEPALSIEPAEAWALPGVSLLTLTPAGGTGDYVFALTNDGSGAQFNADYGTYLPGATAGVDDVVTLTDAGCLGEATATLHVVEPLVVEPTEVVAPLSAGFDLQVAAGSGQYACSLLSDETGATVSAPCRYDGGGTDGTDILRVEDLATGEIVDVRIALDAGAALSPQPSRIWVPVGSDWQLRVDGGSGYVTATVASGTSISASDGWFEAVSPGLTTFDLVDDYTGQTAAVSVWGVPPLEGGFPRAGDNNLNGDSFSPGDVNGDGWADVVLGVVEGDIGNYNTGAIHVYAGKDGGLEPTPIHTYGGLDYADLAGMSVEVADVTGDGELDLLIGAYLSDVAGGDSGMVFLYEGLAGGFFATTPSKTWTGDHGSDWFGYAMATCDFNGDGFLDLAVGAPVDEDRSVSEISYSQGGIWVFLGRATGLPDQADQTVYGSEPDGAGDWTYLSNVRLGSELEAGDVNGDGLCDLVAGAWEFNLPTDTGSDGAVYVYLGTNTGGSSAGLYDRPVAAWAAIDPADQESYFGRELSVADVDGDGRDDILVGQYRHINPNVSSSRHGAARLFLGEPWAEIPAPGYGTPDNAAWTVEGNGGYDALGWEVRAQDVSGDGLADLLVAGYSEEVPGGPSGAGAIHAYHGVQGGLPGGTPEAMWGGELSGDLFGTRFDVLPDMDGDGLPDLFVYAARHELHGTHIGTPFFVSSDATVAPVPLENPGDSAGQRAGEDVALVGDVDGDGFEDALVGVPEYDNAGNRINAGLIQVFGGSAGGVGGPATDLVEFDRYSDGDRWGWRVADAGDFNGDGFDDFAILGRYDDKPTTFTSSYVGDTSCGSADNNQGTVAVFLGTPNGMPTQPSFLWWASEPNDGTRELVGGFDIDGDGFDDLIAGGQDWDTGASNAGGFEIIYGQPDNPGGISILCNTSDPVYGSTSNDRMGVAVAGLGDVDNDGCDEVAIGAYDEDGGYTNQGVVRVVWGFGPNCGTTQPEFTALVPQDTNARSGYAVDGGEDVDGDGVPDLLVGGYSRSTAGNSTGAAWLVPGWYLQSLPREALVSAQPPTIYNLIAPPSGGPWTLTGTIQDEHFGRSVALVPGLGPGGRAGIAVGAARTDLPGVERVGGVQLHVWDPALGGVDVVPWGAFGGESFTPNGRVGETIAAGTVGGSPTLMVGGYRASTWGPAQGAAWVMPLQ